MSVFTHICLALASSSGLDWRSHASVWLVAVQCSVSHVSEHPLIKYCTLIPCTGKELEDGDDGGAARDIVFYYNVSLLWG